MAFRCDVCLLSVNSKEQLTQHFSGSKHKKKTQTQGQEAGIGKTIMKPSEYFVSSGYPGTGCQNQTEADRYKQPTGTSTSNQQMVRSCPQSTDTYCHSCRVQLTSLSQAEMHYKGAKHRNKLRYLEEGDFFLKVAGLVEQSCVDILTHVSHCFKANEEDRFRCILITIHFEGRKLRFFQNAAYNAFQRSQESEMKSSSWENEATDAKKPRVELCEVCNVKLINPAVTRLHYNGDKHRKKVALLEAIDRDGSCQDGLHRPNNGALPAAIMSKENQYSCHYQSPSLPPSSKASTPAVTMSPYTIQNNGYIAHYQTSNPVAPSAVAPRPHTNQGNSHMGHYPPASLLQRGMNSSAPLITAKPSSKGPINVQQFPCHFCDISVNSETQMSAHRSGSKHKNNVEKFASSPQAKSMASTGNMANIANSMITTITEKTCMKQFFPATNTHF